MIWIGKPAAASALGTSRSAICTVGWERATLASKSAGVAYFNANSYTDAAFAKLQWNATYFYPCNSTGNDGASAWVALEPGPNNHTQSSNAIMQIGVINCDNVTNQVCDGNQVQVFIAYGGCGTLPTPDAKYVGMLGQQGASYKVQYNPTGGSYDFYVNTTEVWSVSVNDSKISCWATPGFMQAAFSIETWDAGDSIGSTWLSSQVRMTHEQFHDTTGGWAELGVYNACSASPPEYCSYGYDSTDGTWHHFWTVYQP